jgi:hypothetical protein
VLAPPGRWVVGTQGGAAGGPCSPPEADRLELADLHRAKDRIFQILTVWVCLAAALAECALCWESHHLQSLQHALLVGHALSSYGMYVRCNSVVVT